jgi:acyl-CoA synthetase (AMP-forming)/AMP-acid ligase II
MSAAPNQAELVIDQLARAAEQAPHAPLLPERSERRWRRLTNAEAWAQSGAVASWLIAQGYGPGGRSLAVPADDTPERAVLLLGALRAGALVVEGPNALEFAVLVHCSIDAAVAERRLHIDARTPARQRGDLRLCHGDFMTIAQAAGP